MTPPILERLDLSPELWLHVFEQFGKRRTANRVTPACRFNTVAYVPDFSVIVATDLTTDWHSY